MECAPLVLEENTIIIDEQMVRQRRGTRRMDAQPSQRLYCKEYNVCEQTLTFTEWTSVLWRTDTITSIGVLCPTIHTGLCQASSCFMEDKREQKDENKHYTHESMGISLPLCVGVNKYLLNLHAVCMYIRMCSTVQGVKDGYIMLLPISCNQQVSGIWREGSSGVMKVSSHAIKYSPAIIYKHKWCTVYAKHLHTTTVSYTYMHSSGYDTTLHPA